MFNQYAGGRSNVCRPKAFLIIACSSAGESSLGIYFRLPPVGLLDAGGAAAGRRGGAGAGAGA